MEKNDKNLLGNKNAMKKKRTKKRLIAGATAIVTGSASALLRDAVVSIPQSVGDDASVDAVVEPQEEAAETAEIRYADIDQSLPFDEAFTAARAEVGPGGAFVWHGSIYGTSTADEWNELSAEEQDVFRREALAQAPRGWNDYTPASPEEALAEEEVTLLADDGEVEPVDGDAEPDEEAPEVVVEEPEPQTEELVVEEDVVLAEEAPSDESETLELEAMRPAALGTEPVEL